MQVKQLVDALGIVLPAVGTKDFGLTELRSFRFEEDRVSGYNGELFIETYLTSGLKCAIQALPLIKFLQTLPEGDEVEMRHRGDVVEVVSGDAHVSFPAIEYGEIEVDLSEEGREFKLSDDLLEGIKTCYPFISTDETLPQYRGLYIKDEYVYATDRFRLARYRVGESGMDMFIPDAFGSLIIAMRPPIIQFHKNHLKYITRKTKVYSTVISHEHEPPDYAGVFNKILPASGERIGIIGDLGRTFERGEIVASGLADKTGEIWVTKSGKCILSIDNPKVGNFRENLNIHFPPGNDLKVSVNLTFFRSIVDTVQRIEIIEASDTVQYPIIVGSTEDAKLHVLLATTD